MNQTIIAFNEGYKQIESVLDRHGAKHVLLVCGNSFKSLKISEYFRGLKIPYTVFSGFTPNPKTEEVERGVAVFRESCCDAIISVGGGSAIDVAKCIQLEFGDALHLAVPTTAGTGSESTSFAVAYDHGVKYSIKGRLPDYAILEESVLEGLPLFQKKCAMFDALCQAIESIWSKLATDESREFAKKAIEIILANHQAYLTQETPERKVLRNMMLAANYSGRAINISKTTAAHAMSYGITSMFGLPHGYAVALCLASVWRFMNDSRAPIDHFGMPLDRSIFEELIGRYAILPPHDCSDDQILKLSKTVNAERLNNNPVALSLKDITNIYKTIMQKV